MRALFALIPIALVVGACNTQGTVELQFRSTSSDTQSIVRPPTPGPIPEINPQLRAVITRVDILVDNSTLGATATQNMDAAKPDGWTTIFNGQQQVNLFDFSDVAKTITSAQAPVGTVTQVRLFIDKDVEFIDSTGTYPVACPACTETGITMITNPDIEVQKDNTLHLILNFEGQASLTETANGFLFKPVVLIEGYNDDNTK